VRGLGLSIIALKSRGRPQPACTVDSLPAVEETVTWPEHEPSVATSLACIVSLSQQNKQIGI
jgi:hypothetical protein